MEHDASNTFLVAAASGALQNEEATSTPTMENSVIAAAAEAT